MCATALGLSSHQLPALTDTTDPVTEEAARWAALDKKIIREHKDDEGIVNEFALMYHVRQSFPLHYIVFKQTASHLPHEGNSEQLFSRSGALSDNNGKMSPFRLARRGLDVDWRQTTILNLQANGQADS